MHQALLSPGRFKLTHISDPYSVNMGGTKPEEETPFTTFDGPFLHPFLSGYKRASVTDPISSATG